jgi:hypothetical protein
LSILDQLDEWWDEPDSLIGIGEFQHLEFKRDLYNLALDSQKLEFAKDISAMANRGGGLIVIGVKTERDTALGIDASCDVPAVALSAINSEQMHSIARTWVYPPIRDLDIQVWASHDGRALVSVEVAEASEENRPLMIRGVENSSGRIMKAYFSIAERHGDRVDWLLPEEIHRRIVAGGDVDSRPSGEVSQPETDGEPAAEFDELQTLFADTEWPVFVLQAWPSSPARLEDIHSDQGVRGGLLRQTGLRNGGFNFDWNQHGVGPPRLYGAAGIAWSVGEREGLRILPNGTTTFFGSTGPDLLGWGMEKYPGAAGSVNPTALAELTYEFIRLYKEFVESPINAAESMYRIAVIGEGTLKMTDGHRPTGAHRLRSVDLAEAEFTEVIDPQLCIRESESVAGKLLTRFYGRFGLGYDACPYLDPETRAFNWESFIELDGPGLG